MTPLYYEAHVTVEPLDGDALDRFRATCAEYDFRVADLFMRSGKRSDVDSFCTGRHVDYGVLALRMFDLVSSLKRAGVKVWRWKIESALLDSKRDDSLMPVDKR